MSEGTPGAVGSPTEERLHARVEGRVQGVGFRWFVREHARTVGVRGSVWNADDGSVELVAEGTRAALDALVRALHEGPPHASVRAVSARREAVSAADRVSTAFAIRREASPAAPARSPQDAS